MYLRTCTTIHAYFQSCIYTYICCMHDCIWKKIVRNRICMSIHNDWSKQSFPFYACMNKPSNITCIFPPWLHMHNVALFNIATTITVQQCQTKHVTTMPFAEAAVSANNHPPILVYETERKKSVKTSQDNNCGCSG